MAEHGWYTLTRLLTKAKHREMSHSNITLVVPLDEESPHSIPGQVTNLEGNPIEGVTVETVSECDLTKQPIVYLHGWGAPDDPMGDTVGFAEFITVLNGDDEDDYVLDCNLFYVEGVSSTRTKDQNRQAISDFLKARYDQLSAANPDWRGRFDLIGHSYGGLNSRFYLESAYYETDQTYGDYGIHVDNLFTLGTPHGGSIPILETYPAPPILVSRIWLHQKI